MTSKNGASEWKVLTEVDYLRAEVKYLRDLAGATEQLYKIFHTPTLTQWEALVKLWMSCVHNALLAAGYLKEEVGDGEDADIL